MLNLFPDASTFTEGAKAGSQPVNLLFLMLRDCRLASLVRAVGTLPVSRLLCS